MTLLVQLSVRSPPAAEGEGEDAATGEKRKAAEDPEVDCGREILEDLSRAFRTAVEGREWLNARLLLQFLSLLAPAGLVNPQSLLEVYRGLLTVLNEVGGGGDRSERAVRAVGEGLVRVCDKGRFELTHSRLPFSRPRSPRTLRRSLAASRSLCSAARATRRCRRPSHRSCPRERSQSLTLM